MVARPARRDTERARLGRLVLSSAVVLLAATAADAVGDRGRDGSSSARAATTTTTTTPPVTLMPLASQPGAVPVITRVETTDPVVFLTIDDGWTRQPDALAAFEEADIPASLFLVDPPVEQDAQYFRSMSGTFVEGHTQTHVDLRTVSEEEQRAEICGNADTIENAFGRRPVLFRPPYGEYNDATVRAAAECGMKAIVLWEQSLNGADVSYRSELRFRRGDIILTHFRENFVEELRTVIQHVEAAGLEFALLEDYIVPEDAPT